MAEPQVQIEQKSFLHSLIPAVALVLLMWLVKVTELIGGWSFHELGIFPKKASGLAGVALSPLIHGDFSHLLSNSLPILVLCTTLFYFYRELAPRVLLLSWLITGFWVWSMARPSWHIGASGLVYSLAGFLFFSGMMRRHPRLMAISLLVAFLYGGMVWGVLPVKQGVSWESHLMGLLSGVLLAAFYREEGPQRKKYSWELEEEKPEVDEVTADNPIVPDDSITQDHTGDVPVKLVFQIKAKEKPGED